MTSDFMLTLALSLIAAASALGLLAYIVVLMRRRDENATEAIDQQTDQEEAEMEKEKPAPSEESKEAAGKVDTETVADLMRDKATGQLVVRIGSRDFANASELKDPEDLSRLEAAAEDLVTWLAAREGTKAPTEEAALSKSTKAPIKPKSMIDEINEIIEQRIALGDAPPGLRLFEGPEGTARIYLGVNSYEFEEIPDKKVQRVIKEAVAEWEARQ